MYKLFTIILTFICYIKVLNADDNLLEIKNFLNNLHSVEADFTQIDHNTREQSYGKLFFMRTAENSFLKIYYQQPEEISLLFKNESLIILNHALNIKYHLDLKQEDNIFLQIFDSQYLNVENLEISGQHQESILRFSALNEQIIVIFDMQPLIIKQISHITPDENISLKLHNIIINSNIDKKEFNVQRDMQQRLNNSIN